MTKRYTVTHGSDSMGNRYATGPLTMIDTDSLAEAEHYVQQNGGEVIDHQTRRAWAPTLGWYDADEYLSSIGE